MYTVDYFINKFEAIPENLWATDMLYDDDGKKCANGWCGVMDCRKPTIESAALQKVMSVLNITWFDHGNTPIDSNWDYNGYSVMAVSVNNGWTNEYQQPTPKQRILAALYDIKKMQYPELSNTTVDDLITEVSLTHQDTTY